MEFRCSTCGHIGPADEVRPTGEGVEVVCAECGEASPLDVGKAAGEGEPSEPGQSAEPPAEPDGPTPDPEMLAKSTSGQEERRSGRRRARDVLGTHDMTLDEEDALERLIPEQGSGLRCPKCAALLAADVENCTQCGLHIDDARGYDRGEAPWEQPPEGREEVYEQAYLLWESFEEESSSANLQRFVGFVKEEGLFEMAIRRLRFHLIDEPDNEEVLEALRDLGVGVQGQIAQAKARAQASAEELNADISRLKRRIAWAIIGLWGVAIALAVYVFW